MSETIQWRVMPDGSVEGDSRDGFFCNRLWIESRGGLRTDLDTVLGMSREDVAALLPYLQRFVETGRLAPEEA